MAKRTGVIRNTARPNTAEVPPMPELPEPPPCVKRVQLERAVVAAADAVYSAKGEDKIAARLRERDAVRALDIHIEEHGCR